MEKVTSKAQIDRLGERLRAKEYGEADLRLLDEYRRSFGPAYDHIVEAIQRAANVVASGRPAKSTSSIIEKLNRESIRLSQMQDIAGCRVVVDDLRHQDRTVNAIAEAFSSTTVLDRRAKPSHGYRAVHLIIRHDEKPIEVQVRTALQHVWAEMSEKCADIIDPAIKYGGGPPEARDALDKAALLIRQMEDAEDVLARRGTGAPMLADELREIRNKYIEKLRVLLRELGNVEREESS